MAVDPIFIDTNVLVFASIHDANIVATCLAFKIPRLLTHNVSDFQRYRHLLSIERI